MFKLSETKTFSSGTRYIRPGTYLAEITKVADSEKYFNGDAFVVNYQLYSLDNQTVGEFAETFFNNTANRNYGLTVYIFEQVFVMDNHLGHTAVIAKIDKYNATVVTDNINPACKLHGLSDMLVTNVVTQ
jgi:hypothetical protein